MRGRDRSIRRLDIGARATTHIHTRRGARPLLCGHWQGAKGPAPSAQLRRAQIQSRSPCGKASARPVAIAPLQSDLAAAARGAVHRCDALPRLSGASASRAAARAACPHTEERIPVDGRCCRPPSPTLQRHQPPLQRLPCRLASSSDLYVPTKPKVADSTCARRRRAVRADIEVGQSFLHLRTTRQSAKSSVP